jgi:hypothetical protein
MQWRKPNRKQRELRRGLNATIYSEGFEQGYNICLKVVLKQLPKEYHHYLRGENDERVSGE